MELAGDPTNTAATAKPLSIIEHARHESPDTAARVSDQAHCLPNLITTTEASPAALEPSLQQEYDPKQPEVAQPDSSKEAVEQQSRISASPPAAACQAWIAAAKEGDTKEMHKLLQQHPGLLDYQAGGLRCSALHWTAARGHADAMQQLLLWGADPCALTCTGCTPLFSAAGANSYECVELLLMVPAVQQQLNWANEDGLTAAALALKHGHHMVHSKLQQAAGHVAAGQAAGCSPEGDDQAEAEAAEAASIEGTAAAAPASSSRGIQGAQQQQPTGLRAGFLLHPADRRRTLLGSQKHADNPAAANSDSNVAACVRQDSKELQAHIPVLAAAAAAAEEVDMPPRGSRQQPDQARNAAASTKTQQQQQQQQQHLGQLQQQPLSNEAVVVADAENGGTSWRASNQDSSSAAVSAWGTSSAGSAAEATALAAMHTPAEAAPGKQLGRLWLDAARAGDLQLLQNLVAAHPQLLSYSGAGTSYAFTSNSAAHWAAAKGHTMVLAWLLQQASLQDSNICPLLNQAGATPLHTAAEHGQAACARLLALQGGADVHQLDGLGQSAVQAAAARHSGGQGLAQSLLLWDLVRRVSGGDRCNATLQHLLKLAGRASEAEACLERQELLDLALEAVQRELDQC